MDSTDNIEFDLEQHSQWFYDGNDLRIFVDKPLEFATAMVFLEKKQESMKQNPVYGALRKAFFAKLGDQDGEIAKSYNLILPEKDDYVRNFLEILRQA
tara:strand:+ start:3536 stop:3829 length:294 start_codon:yes stop_codon:yes gene_type:complete